MGILNKIFNVKKAHPALSKTLNIIFMILKYHSILHFHDIIIFKENVMILIPLKVFLQYLYAKPILT